MEINYDFKKADGKTFSNALYFFHLPFPSKVVSVYLVTGVNWVSWYLKERRTEQLLDTLAYIFMIFFSSR